MQDAQQRGLLEVSIKTRFPVIGSRMVMGSPIPFRHTRNAARPNWLKVSCSCGYGTVTARSPAHSRSRRYIRASSALWGCRSGMPSADQQEHGRRLMVNGVLTRTERSDCGTAFLGEHGHISVTRAQCGVPAGEQPVQHRRNRLLGILVDPGVIMGSMRPIYPASRLLAEKPQRVQLLPGDRHWSCPSCDRVL